MHMIWLHSGSLQMTKPSFPNVVHGALSPTVCPMKSIP